LSFWLGLSAEDLKNVYLQLPLKDEGGKKEEEKEDVKTTQ
jgi:hypothetical protein